MCDNTFSTIIIEKAYHYTEYLLFVAGCTFIQIFRKMFPFQFSDYTLVIILDQAFL